MTPTGRILSAVDEAGPRICGSQKASGAVLLCLTPLRTRSIVALEAAVSRHGVGDARHTLPAGRDRRPGRLCRLCDGPEEDLMLVGILYAAAALAVGVYMVVALLRPEKF